MITLRPMILDADQTLQSVEGVVYFLVMRDRFAWGHEVRHYRRETSLTTTRQAARRVAEGWRSAGSNFTILQVPGLLLTTEQHRIALTEFHTGDSYSGWDSAGRNVLRVGTAIDTVIAALGFDGTWSRRRRPSRESFVSRIIDDDPAPEPLSDSDSFRVMTSTFSGATKPITWDHRPGWHNSNGVRRIVSEFGRVNSELIVADWSADGLRAHGFQGFVPFSELPSANVPRGSGIYMVLLPRDDPPAWLIASPAGWFKGKDPTVPVERAAAKWVSATSVLYIGKADAGPSLKRGLQKRIDEYWRHGSGEPVGHWGGRLIWQLEGSDQFLVCWLETDADPELVESQLLEAFVARFGALPYANLKRGRLRYKHRADRTQ